MKTSILGLFVVISITLLSLDFSPEQKTSSFIAMSLGESPVLPTTPYTYEVTLPEHLFPFFSTEGYYTTQIDTTALPLISKHKSTLGRVLFYDKKLSSNEDIACGSCHLQSKSFADEHEKSKGVKTDTKRNSMQLSDLGWSNNNFFFWDLRHNDLAGSVSLPLKDSNEIGANMDDVILKLELSDYYPTLFKNAYGNTEVTEEKILDAIANFISSINTFNSDFDKEGRNEIEFTLQQNRGRDLFTTDCATCHTQGLNRTFINLGLKDHAELAHNGYIDATGDKGVTQNVPALPPLFKISTLRNIELTAPYMHDGGIPDLDSLLNFYSTGVGETHSSFIPTQGFQYTALEKEDLKSFLLTLTDRSMTTNIKWSNPFELTSSTSDLNAEVVIKPNPFMDEAVINITAYDNQRKDLYLRDMQGRTVMQDYFMGTQYRLDKNELSSGIYLLSIVVGDKMGSYKIIVQ